MLFKKDTLTDSDKVRLVNTIAITSLAKYFRGENLLNSSERSEVANEIISSFNGSCSTWAKAKYVAYSETVSMFVIKTPIMHDYYQMLLKAGDKKEAAERLAHITYNGMLMNSFISESSLTYGAEPYVDDLDVELRKVMLKAELNELEEQMPSNPQVQENNANPSEVNLNQLDEKKDEVEIIEELRSPKRAYFAKNYRLEWAAKAYEFIATGEVIYRLIDGDDVYEEVARKPCEIILIEAEEGVSVSKSDFLLAEIRILPERDRTSDGDINAQLSKLKKLYDDGLLSEEVYQEKQKSILQE